MQMSVTEVKFSLGLYRVYTKKVCNFLKKTIYLFLTLHGHNVHSQQRQLSKFLVRYQQFASHAYCGATGPVSKMASQQKKAFCMHRFEVSRSVITVQREFCARFITAGSVPYKQNSEISERSRRLGDGYCLAETCRQFSVF
jgi:hypothetical protein